MQIYWGAIPFVIIQIIMVGAIIAFPAIVSSGLDKKEVYDMNKVQLEMEANLPPAEPQAVAPMPETSASSATATDAKGNESTDSKVDDDPMKALQNSMAAEKK
jgi:GntP family gluconate:H+ symporter